MEQLRQNINIALRSIEETTELFYQQQKQSGLQRLEQTIAILIHIYEEILQKQQNDETQLLNEEKFNLFLSNALSVLADKDYILLADILFFEIHPLLQDVLTKLSFCANELS